MFWLSRNTLIGSWVRLSAFNRSYFSAPYRDQGGQVRDERWWPGQVLSQGGQ
jgi:hypothetical protein